MGSFFSYGFLREAMVVAVIGGTICGLLGVLVVLWRMSLVGILISHAAFAGSLMALWLGFPPMAGGLTASLGAASIVGPLSERPGFTPDTAMGIIFSVMLSLAMLALGLLPGAKTEGLGLIWGSILTTTRVDLWAMSITGLGLLFFIIFCFKEIQAIIGHRQAALAAGIPVRAIYFISLGIMGLTVALALKAIGGLLIYSLIVTPAATALQLTYNLKAMFWLSGLSGAVSSALGLYLSFKLGLPVGAAIVLVSVFFLVLALFFFNKEKR
ncbi:MAG: metal ABC transporter permease [Deltaproteobacteria bacterium]|jgi:manganese/iron transport system permease protein|nr:metal ABC transporter permease [Deltaproteobacteria bacterium]